MRCLLIRSLVATLLCAPLAVAASSSPVDARCAGTGVGSPVPGFNAIEDTRTGTGATCDNDNLYLGRISDLAQDDFCAEAHYFDAGLGFVSGIDCTHNGVYANYSFTDVNGDRMAIMFVCGNACTGLQATQNY